MSWLKLYCTALLRLSLLHFSGGGGVIECNVTYWGRDSRVIWESQVRCSVLPTSENGPVTPSDRCNEQIEHAYNGNVQEIDLRKDLNQPAGSGSWTMLMVASHEGHYKLVKALLENGASVNLKDKCGWSALMLAAFTGQKTAPSVVELLLQYGADINLANCDGRTAVFMASTKGFVEITKVLVRSGANLKHRDVWNKSVMETSVYTKNGCQSTVIKVLLEKCNDIDRDSLNEAIWKAIQHCCPIILHDILCSGVEVSNLLKMRDFLEDTCLKR